MSSPRRSWMRSSKRIRPSRSVCKAAPALRATVLSVQEKRALLKRLLEEQASPGNKPGRLSPAQMRLWEIEANEASTGMHTFALAYTLKGPLDIETLDRAIHAVAARHPGLRVRIASEDGQPCFQLAPMIEPLLQRYDEPENGDESRLEARLRAEAALPLDLGRDRAWRCALFPCSEEARVLLLRFHHIIADRWSVGIFVRDLGTAYSALLAVSVPFDSENPPPAPDDDSDRDAQLAFWKDVFSRPPQPLELPLARDLDRFSGYAGERMEADLDPATFQALKALAATESLTLFPILLAAFAALLRAHTGQEDLVLCTPVTGRHRAGTRQVIGYFNNILPLRLDLQGDPSFLSLAGRVADQARGAYAHQDVPFHRIASLSELDGVRTTRCLFAVQNIPGLALQLPDVESRYRDIPNGTANFDLSLFLEENNGRGVALLDYKTALFSAEAAGELMQRFVALLKLAADRPTARISEFPDYRTRSASEPRPADTEAPPKDSVVVDNMLEQRMIALWRDLFPGDRERPIGPETNFFHIGGDSLKAARLFASLKREFDLEWPLATLIEAPTPRQLVQRMGDKAWVMPWLSLIPLQPDGNRPPLYFLPGGFGNILCFRHIADCLGKDQPVYCLQAKGLKRGEKAMRSVEDTAAYYIDIIHRSQPQGPYLLAGHSFGAVVAYEMARRLLLAGEEVPLLALLDHCGPDIQLTGADYLRYYLMSLSMLSMRDRVRYVAGGIAWKLHAHRALSHRKRAAIRKENPEARWRPIDVAEGALRALRDYDIPPFPGRITLFRAEKHPKIQLDCWGGWGHVAAEGVEIIDVPGTHESMLEEPHVRVLAEKLAICLD